MVYKAIVKWTLIEGYGQATEHYSIFSIPHELSGPSYSASSNGLAIFELFKRCYWRIVNR